MTERDDIDSGEVWPEDDDEPCEGDRGNVGSSDIGPYPRYPGSPRRAPAPSSDRGLPGLRRALDFINSCEDDDLAQQHAEAHEQSDGAPEGSHLFDIAYPHEHPISNGIMAALRMELAGLVADVLTQMVSIGDEYGADLMLAVMRELIARGEPS